MDPYSHMRLRCNILRGPCTRGCYHFENRLDLDVCLEPICQYNAGKWNEKWRTRPVFMSSRQRSLLCSCEGQRTHRAYQSKSSLLVPSPLMLEDKFTCRTQLKLCVLRENCAELFHPEAKRSRCFQNSTRRCVCSCTTMS